ncbi:VOC family protein [Pseudonocardia nigra]|uniref:VOC family protein n=1 Tax=Pseudonocardia nigra TaxID=1921578 RepID=UPI001C60295A|nr:VOC family protein [Pseudonocardia nigra]
MDVTTRTCIADIRTVAVPVRDQDRALEFYVGTLGFETRLDGPFGAGRWVEVAPPRSTTSVALTAAADGAAVGVDTGIRFTTTDAGADHAYLRSHGVDTDPEVLRMPHVPPMFTFRDVDGNNLVIVESA